MLEREQSLGMALSPALSPEESTGSPEGTSCWFCRRSCSGGHGGDPISHSHREQGSLQASTLPEVGELQAGCWMVS